MLWRIDYFSSFPSATLGSSVQSFMLTCVGVSFDDGYDILPSKCSAPYEDGSESAKRFRVGAMNLGAAEKVSKESGGSG